LSNRSTLQMPLGCCSERMEKRRENRQVWF